ncbi:MAG: ABC transporter ATP-binding protein [Syntrophobacteraceae bacterium]
MNALGKLYWYIHRYRYESIAGAAAVILSDIFTLMPPWLIKLAIDHIQNAGSLSHRISLVPLQSNAPIAVYSVLLIAAVALQGTARFFWRTRLEGIARKVEHDLRSDFFQHLQKLHWGFFQHGSTGDIMSRATNDMEAVKEFVGSGMVVIIDCVTIVPLCLVLMAAISLKLLAVSFLPMVAVFVIVIKGGREIKRRSSAIQEQLSELSSMVQENFAGIRVVQAYTQEANELNRFRKLNLGLTERKIALAKVLGAFYPLMILTMGITTALILWIGGMEVTHGRLTLGDYMAFNGYAAMFAWPIIQAGATINRAQRGLVSMERIEEILSVVPMVTDDAAPVEVQSDVDEGKPGMNGEVEFRSLTFAYDRGRNVLSEINLKIGSGSILSIAGPVGCGKSTLVRLIPRIYDFPDGSIFIDGKDIKRMPVALLREIVGYVDQEPFLFAWTVRENIAFGTRSATEEQIGEALRIARLEKDLESFPQGLDTLIGERGVTLSGGQKQRVSIARAVIKKPKVLILDEAFSNLDASTEEQVFANIREALRGTTIILASHRISTIRAADTIVVMKDGRIEEIGDHHELISRRGAYNRIYRKQMLSEKEIILEEYDD